MPNPDPTIMENPKPFSVVSTDNTLAASTGACSVCKEKDTEIYLCECKHWACEGCLTTTIDNEQAWTGCDNCPIPRKARND